MSVAERQSALIEWRGIQRAAAVVWGAERQAAWEASRLALAPAAWRRRIGQEHHSRKPALSMFDAPAGADQLRAANVWLLDTTARMERLRVPVYLSDADLIELASRCAKEAAELAEVAPGVWCDLPELRRRMGRYCTRYGIEPPKSRIVEGEEKAVTDTGAVKRMACGNWWRRKLRASQARAVEAEAIRLGYVHRRQEIYASDATVERRTEQRRRNAAGLESTDAVNTDTGEIYTLARLAEAAVSNPRIRRGELMTRIAGFEAIARDLGHVGEFVTLTTPSKFHAKKTDGGHVIDNPKYEGATPREAQGYLTRCWAAIRAALHRRGIRVYGFRIAEPHHDATPHWHMLFFVAPWLSAGRAAVPRLRAVIRRYALREDGREAGARKNRVEFKAIDWQRGSAAGYVAKYVAKNIDGGGYQVQADIEGDDYAAITPAHRVEAWAATWGIRQFQQIGGPPVGVWRELRKIRETVEASDTVEAARVAADCGGGQRPEGVGAGAYWADYVRIQGGPTVTRKRLAVRVAYTRPGERWNHAAGEVEPAPPTQYGEIAPKAIFGVRDVASGAAVPSRLWRWEIRRAEWRESRSIGVVGVGIAGALGLGAGGVRDAAAMGFDVGAFLPPWSPVNNCTRVRIGDDQKGICHERKQGGAASIDPGTGGETEKTGRGTGRLADCGVLAGIGPGGHHRNGGGGVGNRGDARPMRGGNG